MSTQKIDVTLRMWSKKEKKKTLPWLCLKLAGYVVLLVLMYSFVFSGLFG